MIEYHEFTGESQPAAEPAEVPRVDEARRPSRLRWYSYQVGMLLVIWAAGAAAAAPLGYLYLTDGSEPLWKMCVVCFGVSLLVMLLIEAINPKGYL